MCAHSKLGFWRGKRIPSGYPVADGVRCLECGTQWKRQRVNVAGHQHSMLVLYAPPAPAKGRETR